VPAEAGPAAGRIRRLSREVGLVLATYIAVAIAITWPVAAKFGSAIIGHELSGPWRTIWAHWWTGERLLSDHVWPLTAPEIAFPREGPFSSIAPLNDALSLLPQAVFGLVPAFNLVVLFHLLLALTGGYALARVAGVRWVGALASGLIFGLNSFLLSYGLSSAVVETSTVGWVAWFLAAMVWLVREPGFRPALATGILFACAGIASFYWTVIVAVCMPPLALAIIWERRRATGRGFDRTLWLWVAASIVIAAVVFVPPASKLMATYIEGGAVLEDYADRKQLLLPPDVMAKLAHDFATVSGYLVPGKAQLAVNEDMDMLAQSTYAGWVALILGSIGLRRGRWRWLVMAVWGGVLSLGPFMFVTGEAYRPEAVFWWVGLRDIFPPVRLITSYVRFSAFFFLGLAVLAGFGVDNLVAELRTRGVRPAALAGLALGGLVLVEIRFVSPVTVPLPHAEAYVPAVSLQLAELPKEGAVLDWPQRYPGRIVEVSRYFYYQSAHGRPIPYDFAPTSYMPSPIEGNPFFARLEKVTYGEDYYSRAWTDISDFPVRRGIQDLIDMGFAYVAIHPEFVEAERFETLLGWLDSLLPRVSDLPDGMVVYDLVVEADYQVDSSR